MFSLFLPAVTCCLPADAGPFPGRDVPPLLRIHSNALAAKPLRNTATTMATAQRSLSARGVQENLSVITIVVLPEKTRTGTATRHATDRQDLASRSLMT